MNGWTWNEVLSAVAGIVGAVAISLVSVWSYERGYDKGYDEGYRYGLDLALTRRDGAERES